jgi:alkanesulfonate monooxygenase SsuD/methylene tetrahydromethanopterin reductase-like flavin-dependent oxidoreductase (luciferase family)
MQVGIQLHLPTYRALTMPQLVELGRVAEAGGVGQIWVTDNLQSRNAFVVLAALATSVPVNLGTAVTVQYFRNPVDVADAAAAITELMDDRELGIGLGRGNSRTPNLVASPRPVRMLRETAECLGSLFSGEAVTFDRYPNLASHFNLMPQHRFQMNFRPKNPIPLYCGANGPRGLKVGGESMDGLIFGGEFKAVTGTGRMRELLDTFDDAASAVGKTTMRPKVAEIKLSVSADREKARAFARGNAGSRMLNLYRRSYTDDDLERLGVSAESMAMLDRAEGGGASSQEILELTTDAMVDAIYVAGEPGECRERMVEVRETAEQYGFGQLMFSELGPDADESLRLLCDEILPAL